MKFWIIICGLLCFVQGKTIPELLEEGRMAFERCVRDKMEGLTWNEVENCEERYADLLEDQNMYIPSKEDFDTADLNKDGILMFAEWEEWVQMQNEDESTPYTKESTPYTQESTQDTAEPTSDTNESTPDNMESTSFTKESTPDTKESTPDTEDTTVAV